ncbi:MAG: hypothetical protein WCO44_02850 [Bacteroidota bacterium]
MGKKNIKLTDQKGIAKLEKKFQVIFLSFFPSRKKVEPVMEEKPEKPLAVPEKTAKKEKKEKKPKKEKEAKNDKKAAK